MAVFEIPKTHNVLAGLFDPRLPKSTLDVVTLALLGSQVILWLCLPLSTSRHLFIYMFAFWRLAYNAGLGYILTQQSKKRWIVNSLKRRGWLDANKHPRTKAWIQRQVSIKFGSNYDFDSYPAEWNVWVLFRHSVDVILLNDFVSYFFFGISYFTTPDWDDSKAVIWYFTRWLSGITLVVFNLWVKVDAHRIITDLAWYWADTFFQSLQDLVFDGVFEMAPHPMYSVGYAGYYGLSLISGSETVLFVSLAAHACQFAFLVFFENPHIERTYGQRKPIAMREAPNITQDSGLAKRRPSAKSSKRHFSTSSADSVSGSVLRTLANSDTEDGGDYTETDATSHATGAPRDKGRSVSISSVSDLGIDDDEDGDRATPTVTNMLPSSFGQSSPRHPTAQSKHDVESQFFRHDTVILSNFDILRASDVGFALAIFYMLSAWMFTVLSRRNQLIAIFANALAWRIIHTFVLGNILKWQSERKWMVRHYLKHYHYNDSVYGAVTEAFANWKSIYNISLCMVYASFGILAIACYDWKLTTETLRHTLGFLLIMLHVWTAKAIFEVIGKFGWFYGDFFIRNEAVPLQLYYTGIYRHVNNPERIMGGAAFFGLAIVSGSKLVGLMAVISVLSHFWFLSCVENPHMKRLYGKAMRKEAGVTKTFKGVAKQSSHRAPQIQKAVQNFQGTIEKVLDDTSTVVEEFLRKSAPRLNGYVENTKVLLREQGEKLLITRIADVGALDARAYQLALEPSTLGQGDADLPDTPRSSRLPCYQLGETIKIRWTAPSNCSHRDWIGLYRLGANKSTLITQVQSQKRWLGIYPDEWEGDQSLAIDGVESSGTSAASVKRGSLIFSDHRLFWKPGKYEFRYHHDGKHNVLAISEPFEIVVERPRMLHKYASVYNTLLPLVSRCLNDDVALIPESAYTLLDLPSQPSKEELAKIHGQRADTDDFVIFTESQAERIADAIYLSCGLELTSEVVMAEANVAKLTRSVVDARALLLPFDSADASPS